MFDNQLSAFISFLLIGLIMVSISFAIYYRFGKSDEVESDGQT